MLRRRSTPDGWRAPLVTMSGVFVFWVTGCSTAEYREDADSEVYRIIEEKQSEYFGTSQDFTINRPSETARDRIQALLERHQVETLGQKLNREIEEASPEPEPEDTGPYEGRRGNAGEGAGESGAAGIDPGQEIDRNPIQDPDAVLPEDVVPDDPSELEGEPAIDPAEITLTLRDCLEVAAENSRPFQDQRESVYRTVLSLTLQRWNFSIQNFGFLSSRWNYQGKDSAGNDVQTVSVNPNYTVSRRFEQGASVVFNIGASLLRTITGGGNDSDVSLLGLSMTQPLLRGAGVVASESLTQAERSALYAIRSFERFKKILAVQVTSEYYRVLQARTQVDNEQRNLAQLEISLGRSDALAAAGRLPEFQVDQTRQQVLSARSRLISARVSYLNALDRFKVTLGLPPEAPVDLDRSDLEVLPDPGEEELEIAVPVAVRYALRTRLDLQNTIDQVVDAERKVNVAANDLETELNLVGNMDVTSRSNRLGELRFDEARYSAGLDLDLPFSRLPERNNYRTSLINLQAAQRDEILSRDQISLDIRVLIRSLELARETITIQKNAVDLAERRVQSTKLLLEAGRVTSRDLLESQQALVDSQNSLVRSRVDYLVNQLELLRDLEMLSIEPGGLNILNDLEELESLRDDNDE
ncbi:MAG: TolC family protein [Planctomycetota bacterium]